MLTKWLIKELIILSQRIPLFQARGSYSSLKDTSDKQFSKFAKSETEFNDEENFLSNLGTFNFKQQIEQKLVLDYGSGYGGRSVWMAKQARWVEGVEINPSQVEISQEFALYKNVKNVNFSLGSEEKIFFGDNYFDVIVSFDVLEHVKRPDLIIKEFFRVLKDDGIAILIFTPYYGMFSHHLNYITLFPALHWLFPPKALIDSINELIEEHPKLSQLAINKQPQPSLSYNQKRECLPMLNGLTKPEYIEIIKQNGFKILELKSTPILEKFAVVGKAGITINQILNKIPGLDEYLSHNLVSVISKE
jgi:ubiquinone/menaquinone biosynthesis C-methylase UbiE